MTPDPAIRRGVAVLAFVAALLVIGTFSLLLLQLTATTNDASTGHFYSTNAFYAAESGVELALVELNGNQTTGTPPSDIDSDGTVGTISNDGNAANDPALATGAFFVQPGANPATYQARGRPVVVAAPWSGYQRALEIEAQ